MPQERKILVADNDQEFLLSCQYAFSILGMQTIFVPKHGQMLLDAIRKERPDLVICPIFMAYCDAVQIMEKLRADKTAFCPDFIALSSSDNELLFDHFLSSGGAYVFIKPLDSTVLAERVFLTAPKGFTMPLRKAPTAVTVVWNEISVQQWRRPLTEATGKFLPNSSVPLSVGKPESQAMSNLSPPYTNICPEKAQSNV